MKTWFGKILFVKNWFVKSRFVKNWFVTSWLGRLLPVIALPLIFTGCASIGPPEAPSLELPKEPADLHAARKGDNVTLTWTIPTRTTERQSVRYLGATRVCRSATEKLKACGTPIGEVSAPPDFEKMKAAGKKMTARFNDKLDAREEQKNPKGFATYAVEVLNTAGRGAGVSNQVRVPLVPTHPPFAAFAAQVTAEGVKLSWQCPPFSGQPSGIQYLFRIYRRPDSRAEDKSEDKSAETKIADVAATACAEGPNGPVASSENPARIATGGQNPATSFLDQSFEWEKTYFYRGTVVSVVEEAGKPAVEVEGDDTPEVKVFAHDIFPPAVPSGLQAVFSGPGQQPFIDLIWTPVGDADLAGYNVYREEAGSAPVKLNADLVKTPAYRDDRVMANTNYLYSVTSVDERGNESAKSQPAAERVP